MKPHIEKILSVFLAITVVANIIPVSTFADYTPEIEIETPAVTDTDGDDAAILPSGGMSFDFSGAKEKSPVSEGTAQPTPLQKKSVGSAAEAPEAGENTTLSVSELTAGEGEPDEGVGLNAEAPADNNETADDGEGSDDNGITPENGEPREEVAGLNGEDNDGNDEAPNDGDTPEEDPDGDENDPDEENEELPSSTTYILNDNPALFNLTAELYVNGSPVTADTTVSENDSFILAVKWILPSLGGYTFNPGDKFVYILSDDLFLLNSQNVTDTYYNKYTVSGNTLTGEISSTFLDGDNPNMGLNLDGQISFENVVVDDSGCYSVTIPGIINVNFPVKLNTGLSITKTAVEDVVEIEGGEHAAYVNYTVTLTSLGRNYNVSLEDKLYYVSYPGSGSYLIYADYDFLDNTLSAAFNGVPLSPELIEVSKVSNIVTPHNEPIYPNYPGTVITVKGSDGNSFNMDEGDTLTLTYRVLLRDIENDRAATPTYSTDRSIINDVSAMSDQCNPVTDKTTNILSRTSIYKAVDLPKSSEDPSRPINPDMPIRWRIYVKGGEFSSLTVKDIESENVICPDDAAVYIYKALARGQRINYSSDFWDQTTYGDLKNGYTVTFPDDTDWLVFEYYTSGVFETLVKNKAQIVENEKWSEDSIAFGYTETNGSKSIEQIVSKRNPFGGDDYFSLYIQTQMTISIGTEALFVDEYYPDGFSFEDYAYNPSYGGFTFFETEDGYVDGFWVLNADTGEYEAKNIDDYFNVTVSSAGRTLSFKFKDEVLVGTYRFTFWQYLETLKTYENFSGQVLVWNRMRWKNIDNRWVGESGNRQWNHYNHFYPETKESSLVSRDRITWKIGSLGISYRFKETEYYGPELYAYSTVVDTLPAGLKFEAAAYGNPDPANASADQVATPLVKTENEDGTTTLEFRLYPDAVTPDPDNPTTPEDLYILTSYSGNYPALTEEIEFTNNVRMHMRIADTGEEYYDGDYFAASATQKLSPPTVADKGYLYNTYTAPFAQYTVTLNPEALNLIDDEEEQQTYSITDTMAAGLRLDTVSAPMRINGVEVNVNGTTVTEYGSITCETYGLNKFVISGLKDATAYVITYNAKVVLPEGEEFTEENSSNTLETTLNIDGKSNASTVLPGYVLESSSHSSITVAYVQVYKVDDREPAEIVKGAVFEIYQIATPSQVEAGIEALPETGTLSATLTTDSGGYTDSFRTRLGYIYAIKEKSAPPGYIVGDAARMKYFGIRSQDMVTNGIYFPQGVQELTLTGVSEYLFEYINSYRPTPVRVAFSGTKTLTGRTLAAEEFRFTLTGDGGVNETVTNDADGNIVFSEITYSLPGEYRYTVKEEDTDEAGVTKDSRIYSFKVTVTDSGNGQLAAEISGDTSTGTDLNFANSYVPDSTSVTLGGTKTFTGFPENSAIEPEFTFTLSENNAVIDTVTVSGSGSYAFESLTYTDEGEHIYTVVETAGNQAGVTYDTHTYTVKVTVTDDKQGSLVASLTNPDSGAPVAADSFDFTNSYTAAPVDVTFSGTKTLTGRALAAEEFRFTLTGADDGINETVRNAADGAIRFSKITYSRTGEYSYTVKEEDTDEAGITKDSRIYSFKVTVTDSGNGQLAAEISGDTSIGTDLNFLNTFSSGSLAISKVVTGNLADRNRYFSFAVTFNVPGEYSYTGSSTGSISSGGTVQLKHGDRIIITGLPAGTLYQVTEVTSNGYSVYSTDSSGTILVNGISNAAFTNTLSSIPKTGDNGNLNVCIRFTLICFSGLLGTLMTGNGKRRRSRKHL